ncbi:MAG: hypothetical protein HOJ48_12600 [Desulfobacula sp.]|jgi:hypothetical protein|nr:hypothetical protein [Desulfobacula sp.]
MQNLDYMAAKYGQQIIFGTTNDVKQLENNITSALNILHGQGVYAMFLWLCADVKRYKIGQGLDEMLRDDDFPLQLEDPLFDAHNPFDCLPNVITNLTSNLKTMIYVVEMINQSLTYARHSAKAS